jgi:TolB-like protein
LRADHISPVIADHGGEIIKQMGDGWIATFPGVSAPVDCAMELLNRLATPESLRLRIGCHIGEVIHDEEDFYGAGVNIAQRAQTEAPPGGLMVSEDLFRQLPATRGGLLKEAGTFHLKNIAQPVRLYSWRPNRGQAVSTTGATSIAVAPIEYAPATDEARAISGDLRDQLVIRMSRRVGVLVFDGEAKQNDQTTYILRSRLRVAGGRGRLSLSLILRSDQRPVWSQSYDGDTNDIFAFCDDVLEKAEGDLRLQTNAFDGDRLSLLPVSDLSVSELRARAANQFYKVTMEGWQGGRDLMEQAIRLSPHDGVSLCMRAEADIMLHAARYHSVPPDLRDRMARDLDIAVEQVPRSDYVFWARGMFRVTVDRDTTGAQADLRRSRDINPAYSETHELEGHILSLQGDFDGAARAYARSVARGGADPLRPARMFMRAVALFCAGRYDEAVVDAADAADIRPTERGLQVLHALCLEHAGDTEKAARVRMIADRLPTDPTFAARKPVLPDAFEWVSDAIAPA